MMLSLSVSVKKYLFVIDSSEYEFDVGTYINIYYPLQVYCRHNNHALCKTLLTTSAQLSNHPDKVQTKIKPMQCWHSSPDIPTLYFNFSPQGGCKLYLQDSDAGQERKTKINYQSIYFPDILYFWSKIQPEHLSPSPHFLLSI